MTDNFCTAKIHPFPDNTEFTCFRLDHGLDIEHMATIKDGAYPGSSTELYWFEDDRRNFRGDWVKCTDRMCVFPNGHRGNHAF